MTKLKCKRENCYAVNGICTLEEINVSGCDLQGNMLLNFLDCPMKGTMYENPDNNK